MNEHHDGYREVIDEVFARGRKREAELLEAIGALGPGWAVDMFQRLEDLSRSLKSDGCKMTCKEIAERLDEILQSSPQVLFDFVAVGHEIFDEAFDAALAEPVQSSKEEKATSQTLDEALDAALAEPVQSSKEKKAASQTLDEALDAALAGPVQPSKEEKATD